MRDLCGVQVTINNINSLIIIIIDTDSVILLHSSQLTVKKAPCHAAPASAIAGDTVAHTTMEGNQENINVNVIENRSCINFAPILVIDRALMFPRFPKS